jgi:hypothetical protein
MKLFTLFCLLSFTSFLGYGQGAVAVNDSASMKLGEMITLKVVENDYHPTGQSFRILNAFNVHSYTDSTVTFYASYDQFYNICDTLVAQYTLIDKDGNIGEESLGTVYVEIMNNQFSGFLDINNIRAKINCWGNHFWQGPDHFGLLQDIDTSMFEYPNGSHKNTIFNQSLWIGGLDDNLQLRLSAERYRQVGYDFWNGPLSMNGTEVDIDKETVYEWHRVWNLKVKDILYHKDHWSDPGYEPVEAIRTWPAHGDPEKNQSEYLAPFIDIDGDSFYDPTKGDYPLIRGDQCIFFIINDVNEHTETDSEYIGLEIHGMAYEFDQPELEPIHNTVFLSYKVFNRSQFTLHNAYIGILTDFDLGYAWDDFVGCDVGRGTFYGYNGDDFDEDPPGSNDQAAEGYGENPPAQGIVVLGGPYLDANEMDDPHGGCDESINGVGFGDGIADNERYGMKKFLYFNNTVGIQGDPQTAEDYYNYMKGIWKDGTAMEYGGNGHISSGAYGPASNFMFPGLSDPCYWGTNGDEPYGPVDWTEEIAGNDPGDRRGLSVMGPFTFLPGAMHKVDMAFVTARGEDGPSSSVDLLMEYIDQVKEEYYSDSDYFGYQWLDVAENPAVNFNQLEVYPNPVGDLLWITNQLSGKEISYVITDSYGRQIVTGQLNQSDDKPINLQGLKKGLYVITVQDQRTLYTAKILKR